MIRSRRSVAALFAAALALGVPAVALASTPPAEAPQPHRGGGAGDAELREALFGYFERRLRTEVGLSDDQFATVMPVLREMERERSRAFRERRRANQELRRAYRQGASDDDLDARLREVREIETESRARLGALMDDVDRSLTARQRVELRDFLQRFRDDVRQRMQELRRRRGQGAPSPRGRRPRPESSPSSDPTRP